MINRELHVYDMTGASALHAEEIAPDDWRWTEPGMSGLARGNWESMITWADGVVAIHDYVKVESGYHVVHMTKKSRNVWVDGQFMTPNQWLPAICPRKPEGSADEG